MAPNIKLRQGCHSALTLTTNPSSTRNRQKMLARLRGLHRKYNLSGQEMAQAKSSVPTQRAQSQVELMGGTAVNETVVLLLLLLLLLVVSSCHHPMSHRSEVGKKVIQLDLHLLEDDHRTHRKKVWRSDYYQIRLISKLPMANSEPPSWLAWILC